MNTLILLTSGATVTVCHNCLITGDRTLAINSLIATVLLAIAFTGFQVLNMCTHHSLYQIVFTVHVFSWLQVFMVFMCLLVHVS